MERGAFLGQLSLFVKHNSVVIFVFGASRVYITVHATASGIMVYLSSANCHISGSLLLRPKNEHMQRLLLPGH
jgi:hypothetical protein